jgi:hypothetical protein
MGIILFLMGLFLGASTSSSGTKSASPSSSSSSSPLGSSLKAPSLGDAVDDEGV